MATRLIGTDSTDPWLPDVVKAHAVQSKVDDVAGNFASGDVEGVLAELVDLVDTIVVTGGSMPAASGAETIAGLSTTKAVTPNGLAFERPYLDVRTCGAVGDGVADDTAAIQAAVDALVAVDAKVRGGRIVIPAGRYRITATVTINQGSTIIEGVGRGGYGGTEVVWDGAAGAPMFDVRDSSAVQFRDLILLGKAGAAPSAGIYFEQAVVNTVGTNEHCAVRGVSFGRRYTTDGIGAAPLAVGVLVGGASDTNNDSFLIEDCEFFDCSTAGLSCPNTQSIWGLVRNCMFDTCVVGMYLSCSIQAINVMFNRCGTDLYGFREMVVKVDGYWSEHSARLFDFSQSAGLQINGGRVLLHAEVTAAYWGHVAGLSKRSLFALENLRVVQSGAAGTPYLWIEGTSSALEPGRVLVRGCDLPRGDTSAGYVVNGYAASGLYVDIRQGDYEHYGFAVAAPSVGRGGGMLERRVVAHATQPVAAIAETCDRRVASGALTATSGTLYMTAIALPRGVTVSTINVVSGATPGAALTNQWAGLFNLNRQALALSGDLGAAAWAANTFKAFALSASYVTTYDGIYFIGLLVAAGTMPNFIAQGGSTVLIALGPNLSAATTDTGMTAPPALPFTAGPFAVTRPGLAYGYVS